MLEACDSLKLLSIYFDLCVDASDVICTVATLHFRIGGSSLPFDPKTSLETVIKLMGHGADSIEF